MEVHPLGLKEQGWWTVTHTLSSYLKLTDKVGTDENCTDFSIFLVQQNWDDDNDEIDNVNKNIL